MLLIKSPEILRHLIIEQSRIVHRVEPRVEPFTTAIVRRQAPAAAAVDDGAVGARIEIVDPRRAVVEVERGGDGRQSVEGGLVGDDSRVLAEDGHDDAAVLREETGDVAVGGIHDLGGADLAS